MRHKLLPWVCLISLPLASACAPQDSDWCEPYYYGERVTLGSLTVLYHGDRVHTFDEVFLDPLEPGGYAIRACSYGEQGVLWRADLELLHVPSEGSCEVWYSTDGTEPSGCVLKGNINYCLTGECWKGSHTVLDRGANGTGTLMIVPDGSAFAIAMTGPGYDIWDYGLSAVLSF